MRKLLPAIIIVLLLNACSDQKQDAASQQDWNKKFDTYKENFVLELWKLYPGWASSQGYHNYDSVLVVPNAQFREKELAFCNANLDSLKAFVPDSLSANNRADYYILENAINSFVWYSSNYKSYEWDPSSFNVGSGFAEILASNEKLENKLGNLFKKMKNIPEYYSEAKRSIKQPTIEHTDLAILQNKGSIDVFAVTMLDSLKTLNVDEKKKEKFEARVKESVKAIEDYIAFLEKEVKPKLTVETARSFRLGKELYDSKFKYDIVSGFTAEEIYKKALERKEELHKEMHGITSALWSKYFKEKQPEDAKKAIKMMIDKLSLKHVDKDSFQTSIEKQIPELVDFVNKKQLLYLDPSKPLVVRKEPAYMQGVAGASISAPGPYDKNGNTYYNVGTLAHYSKEDAESYLREYNHYILQILNIHEAIPGHYAQLVYSNQSPSIIKSILGNGAMVEGWAVYTERMMLEEGYGNGEPEMWLMYYKWHLRATCNTILDYGVHVLGMTNEDAMNLLVNEAFQQEAEAKGKWRRVSLTQVQLTSYFTGFTEIYALREEIKKIQGDKFNLKNFHEKFLSYGSTPVKYIREMMLAEMK